MLRLLFLLEVVRDAALYYEAASALKAPSNWLNDAYEGLEGYVEPKCKDSVT